MSEIRIVTVVGNPKAGSRTLAAASTLASGVAERLREVGEFDPVVAEPIDLAVIADGLLAPWRLSPAAANAVDSARSAAVLVLATPTTRPAIRDCSNCSWTPCRPVRWPPRRCCRSPWRVARPPAAPPTCNCDPC
ncbi:MAG: hypothetical protein U0R72_07665 [Nakamurella multipartita]